jgi:hypothetical protein
MNSTHATVSLPNPMRGTWWQPQAHQASALTVSESRSAKSTSAASWTPLAGGVGWCPFSPWRRPRARRSLSGHPTATSTSARRRRDDGRGWETGVCFDGRGRDDGGGRTAEFYLRAVTAVSWLFCSPLFARAHTRKMPWNISRREDSIFFPVCYLFIFLNGLH